MRKFLVTGAAGFIGMHVSQALLQRGPLLTFVLLEGVGVNIVYPQTRHHVTVERDFEALARLDHQHIGHHQVALKVDKAPPGLGIEPADDADGCFDQSFAQAGGGHQAFDVALGQQLHGLLAHRNGGAGLFGVALIEQLQAQAFGQVARAHASGLHVVQQAQGHQKTLLKLFKLFQVVAGQRSGQLLQAVFQIAVVVERFNEEMQGRAVFIGQAQREGLSVQVLLQGLVAAGQLDGIGLFVVVVVLARRRIAAPFAVVGRGLDRAIALPAFFERCVGVALAAGRLRRGAAVGHRRRYFGRAGRAGRFLRAFKITRVLGDRRVGLVDAKVLALGGLVAALEKRVFVEHLLDLLAQLQGRQLQQADGLL